MGSPDIQNAVRFQHEDIDQVRLFLRRAGLDCDVIGWYGYGRMGMIEYHQGEWHGSYWDSDDPVLTIYYITDKHAPTALVFEGTKGQFEDCFGGLAGNDGFEVKLRAWCNAEGYNLERFDHVHVDYYVNRPKYHDRGYRVGLDKYLTEAGLA